MFAGMAVLGFPAGRAMDAIGATSDEFMFLGMATTMTAGMVAWMLYRGHGWRATWRCRLDVRADVRVIGLLWAA